jgi:hypothetical protein
MSSPIARLLILICAALAVVPATAGAASKSTAPKVTSVTPLSLKIGDRMTVKGRGFLKGRNRNTVVFKASGQRAVFVKAQSATSTKLVVKVPAKLATFLKVRSGRSVATRFQLRVLSRKLSKAYTPAKGSPVIAPVAGAPGSTAATKGATRPAAAAATPAPPVPDCYADGTRDAIDGDDDNDLLLDTTEKTIGTNPCSADSDGDGMEDGWEYKSAVDLKQLSCPHSDDYPVPCEEVQPDFRTRAYPNPLDGGDAGSDYDGDSLIAIYEFTAWKRKAAKDAAWRQISDLWYSAGLQASRDTSSASGCRGMEVPEPFDGKEDYKQFDRDPDPAAVNYPADDTFKGADYSVYSLDRVGRHAGDGCLDDAERDEDGDYLTNWDETVGPFKIDGTQWWAGVYSEPAFKSLYYGTDWLDADTDNDKTVDGLDDQDHDDFLNVEERYRGDYSRTKSNADGPSRLGLWVQPYNPCLPSPNSRTCPPSLLLDRDAWRPFKKADDPDPVPRWPLYGIIDGTRKGDDISDVVYDPADSLPEVWSGAGFPQRLPAQHPLPRPLT